MASSALLDPMARVTGRNRAPAFAPLRPRASIGLVLHDFALGGTERIAVRLANCWAGLGLAVEIFCGTAEGPLQEMLHPSVIVRRPIRPIRRGRGSLRRLGLAARTHFDRFPVDAVYIPGNTHWPVVRALASLPDARRPRIIAQISAALEKPQRGAFGQRLFERRMRHRLADADQIVSMCWEAARQASRMLDRKDVSVIPLPALDDDREHLPRAMPADRIVFAASRLVPGKGVEHLVRAFAQITHPTARLVIAGSGPNEAALRQLAADLGLGDRVEWLGYVPDIRPWLDRARFFAMPSDHEGYGAVIVEALAAGRPVLATDCSPAVRELLGDGEAGLVVPIGNVTAIARGIDAMLNRAPVNPHSLAVRVERFRIGPVARRYLSLVGIVPGTEADPARLLVPANDAIALPNHCTAADAAL